MKYTLAIILSLAVLAHSYPSSDQSESTLIGIAQDEHGDLQYIYEDSEVEPEVAPFWNAATDVIFRLYTSTQNTTLLTTDNGASILASSFNSANPTAIITHGWNSDGLSANTIASAYLQHGGVNVIVVDWSSGAQHWNYITVKGYVPSVGSRTATLINQLVSYKLAEYSDMILIGHSLGAHVMGFAGKEIKSTSGQPLIGKIVGLEPTWLLYSYTETLNRLYSGDAIYVQSVHTSSLGFSEQIGHVAVYPNGGDTQQQPGCSDTSCSHSRSWLFYAESVQASVSATALKFVAKKCTSSTITDANCQGTPALNMGGHPLDTSAAAGQYFVTTNSAALYAQG